MYPKALGIMVVGMLLVGLGVAYERWARLSTIARELKIEGWGHLLGREEVVPNYHHLWHAHDMAFVDGRKMPICLFGGHINDMMAQWSRLCPMDTDGDGFTNGEELGDPCCRWEPSESGRSSFAISAQKEYRRWGLSNPGNSASNLTGSFPGRLLTPQTCSGYDDKLYVEQFRAFYFRNADGAYEPTPLVAAKVVSLGALLALLGFWGWKRSLCVDVVPWLSAHPHITRRTSVVVSLLAFAYMDVTSGIVHLILDYAPHWLPVLGGLARGFQFHHHDPTAIIRISWYAYVSHIHLLCPIVAALLVLSDASRVQRLFWFWGAVYAHLFQTTHRWAHFPPEQLPWVVRSLQDGGLLLTHERHMRHHEDLEKQFTILSGHADVLLDSALAMVPPIRYDIWLFIGIVWFLLPVALDIKYRRLFDAMEFAKNKTVKQQAEGFELKDLDL